MNVSKCFALLAALMLSSAVALADTMTFRNDSRTPVVVQTATLMNGRLKSDRPLVLRPGETGPGVMLDGDKMITVYDAKSNRILIQSVQRTSPIPLSFSIQPDTRTPGKAKLVPYRK